VNAKWYDLQKFNVYCYCEGSGEFLVLLNSLGARTFYKSDDYYYTTHTLSKCYRTTELKRCLMHPKLHGARWNTRITFTVSEKTEAAVQHHTQCYAWRFLHQQINTRVP